MDTPQKNVLSEQATTRTEVYDLLNCGDLHRFTLSNNMVVSNCVQATGHDCLLIMTWYLDQLRQQSGIDFYFVFSDFHDQFILECQEKDADQVVQFVNQALDLTNQELQGTIKLRGIPQVVTNLWEAKK